MSFNTFLGTKSQTSYMLLANRPSLFFFVKPIAAMYVSISMGVAGWASFTSPFAQKQALPCACHSQQNPMKGISCVVEYIDCAKLTLSNRLRIPLFRKLFTLISVSSDIDVIFVSACTRQSQIKHFVHWNPHAFLFGIRSANALLRQDGDLHLLGHSPKFRFI